MEQYIVTGMSCAACQARVEKAVSCLEGVKSVSVSLLTNSMGVEGTASESQIIKAVENAGYGARKKSGAGGENHSAGEANLSAEEDALKDRETPVLKKRLIFSVGFLCLLMYITMGHTMLDFPLPSFLNHNHLALTLTQLLLSSIVMIINGKFFTNGFRSLLHVAPNMDTLVALGSSVSFGWSVFVFYKMCGMIANGATSADLMEIYHNELYFESAAMIPALITVGKLLESLSKGRTTNALKSLMKLAPKTAVVVRNDSEVVVPIEEVVVGDIFVVRPGEAIPVDGIVIEGESAVNESALTGESIPVDKTVGGAVNAGTINTSGFLKCKATKVGKDTTLSQIINLVSDSAATKAPIARIADKVSAVFVPTVIAISVIVIFGWLIFGESLSFALARGISVLVISCPCALGLATPVAIMVGNGIGAKSGILFKTSESLENAGKIKVVALDKTGTITNGNPKVTDIIAFGDFDESEFLKIAYSVEKKSEHPLAKAVCEYAKEKNSNFIEASDFKAISGNGLEANCGEQKIHAGSEKFIKNFVDLPSEIAEKSKSLSEQGKTPLFFEKSAALLGIIAVADTIKSDSASAISELKKMKIKTVMLTGDNERTAKAIAKIAGVDKVVAGVLPEGKEAAIQNLQKEGKTCMVGDGINDAPALTRADVGIAIGAGTDVAVDSADIVLMNNSLSDVVKAIQISKKTLKNIHENLFWAFFYNVICIPLAAGLFSYKMNPMIGAAAMSLSSVTVCLNALRLNIRRSVKMTKTVKIKGMMCAHCEATVKKALEALPFVEQAEPSHKKNNAVLTINGNFDENAVKAVVEDKGYEFLGVE